MLLRILTFIIGIILIMCPYIILSQEISNIHFEQVGKQIHIYYDLEGESEYTVQAFCSSDGGQIWSGQLIHVTGDVGKNQKPGIKKKIIWDVLEEREGLQGEVVFRITAKASIITGLFTDKRDGQQYKWVKIGKQVWMAENLNYKKSKGSWCYKNNISYCDKYGRLYTWEAALNACPSGWHLPSDEEWKVLEMYLGMSQSEADGEGGRGTDEGKKQKSTTGWDSGGNGTDEVDFTALPGGYRSTSGYFYNVGLYGGWWSVTEHSSPGAWSRGLRYDHSRVRRNYYGKGHGFSVRCVRD